MRVAQYIAGYLADQGVEHVFMLTGGGAMFLNDAFAYEGRITPVYGHHEQACAMAAEGYARVRGKPGVVNVTTGPGGINALNGVFGAFTDSIPMLVISGQVKRATHLGATPVPGLRQLGDQEADIASIARPICKKVYQLFDPADAPRVLAEAWALCQHGRPGPVWIDVPIDVQSADIQPPAEPVEADLPAPGGTRGAALDGRIDALLDRIQSASRPLFLWGTGVRIAGQAEALLQAARTLQVPVATAWTHDTIATSDPLFAGRPGTIGTRAGNMVLQTADLVVVLGSRLNVRQTSYNFESFAKNAHVVQVDIDPAELDKPLFRPHEALAADLADFAPALRARIAARRLAPAAGRDRWLAWIARPPRRVSGGRAAPTSAARRAHQPVLVRADAVRAGARRRHLRVRQRHRVHRAVPGRADRRHAPPHLQFGIGLDGP
jgi:acetolactate synthase I/II/III large subunit